MSTPEPTCIIPREDGRPCGPVLCRGMCSAHYWRAWRAENPRVPPGARPRELGNAPVQYAFYVPQELAQRVRAAVEASGLTKARWLEAAIRAQLERERRAPPPPGELVGALQDRCHEDSGPVRPGRSR